MTELLTRNQPDLDATICNYLRKFLIPAPGRIVFAAFPRKGGSRSPKIHIQRAVRMKPYKKHYITLCAFDTNYGSQVLVPNSALHLLSATCRLFTNSPFLNPNQRRKHLEMPRPTKHREGPQAAFKAHTPSNVDTEDH
jgi:hypothetical protein